MRKILTTILIAAYLLGNQSFVKSQTTTFNGIVKDKLTGETLPFVHVIYNRHNEGVTSDIDGGFKIKDISKTEFLKFTYVGYKTLVLPKHKYQNKSFLTIKLEKKTIDINEVTVYPGENPAHRIIKEVLNHKKSNNPDNIESYIYTAYHKLYFTADIDSKLEEAKKISEANSDSTKTDSTYIQALEAKKFIDSLYFFMLESVSEKKYKKPNKISEKILANRVAGFKNPTFMFLASQLQSFSIYEEMFNLLDKRYISPVSNGCINRYFYNIEDTAYTELGDTVFVISYKPHRGRNFAGLRGVLNINTNNYAVQNVIAEPSDSTSDIEIQIIQNYKLIENKYWFPHELNTNIILKKAEVQTGNIVIPILGIGKSYIKDVVLGEKYKNSEFSAIELEYDAKSSTRNDSIWLEYRGDSLTTRELNTYSVIDSVGDANNLDAKFKIAQTVIRGYIPIGAIEFNPFSILDFNMYEGYRPMLKVRTNDKISKFFSIGGFAAYGFKDKKWKYGGNLDFNISEKQEIKLKFKYLKNAFESSSYSFFEPSRSIMSSEDYRNFLIQDMSYQTAYSTSLEFRALKYLKANIFAAHSKRWNTEGYSFKNREAFDAEETKYPFTETGIQLKYAPNDKKAMIAGSLFPISSNSSPVFYFNYIRGLKLLNGDFDYTKLEAKLDINFLSKSFGRTYIQIAAGKLFGNLPYFMMYNGHGSYYKFTVDVSNSFATMRMNEFLSDEFLALYFRQDFGSLLFKTKKFKPNIIFATNVTFGQLQNHSLHKMLKYSTLEKGCFESGIIVNNIIPYYKFAGLGIGVFYRYGNYTLPKIIDNFAFKLTISINF